MLTVGSELLCMSINHRVKRTFYNKTVPCPSCSCRMMLVKGKHGLLYSCVCGLIGAANQHNGKPLGIPADSETRLARTNAHTIFDIWIHNKKLTRKQGYYKLSQILKLHPRKTHIGMLTKQQCELLIKKLTRNL